MASFDVPLSAIATQSPAGQRINGYEHIELARTAAHLSNVPSRGSHANRCRAADVKEADRIGLELLLCGRVAVHVGQAGYTMPLQTTMQGGSRQTRDRRLQGIKAVVERQQAVPPKGNNHRLVLDAENRGMGFRRAHGLIANRGPLAPFLNRGRADRMVPGKRPYTLFTPLYRATDRLCRGGAAVKNLSQIASRSEASIVTPLSGTIHLGRV